MASLEEIKTTTQSMINEIIELRDDYKYEARFVDGAIKKSYKGIVEDLSMMLKRVKNKISKDVSINSCPACATGALICDSCGHKETVNPNPSTLSNTDAFYACSCPACDGGILECDECDYTFDSLQGYNEGTF